MSSIRLLGNPAAGDGAGRLDEILRLFRALGEDPDVLQGLTADGARHLAREAVRDGVERLICVGGDGIVRIAADATAGSDTILGVIPHGTGNDFARALGLAHDDLPTAVQRCLRAPLDVDAIETDRGWVSSVATLGFSGDVTERANALRWPRGENRYALATLLQLPRLRTLALTLDIDGCVVEEPTSLLALANTAYFGGGMRVAPGARPDDELIEVVSIADVSRLRFARVFPQAFTGRHVSDPAVSVRRGRVVTVTGTADVWADGDPLGPLPMTFTSVSGALKVAGASLD